MRHIKKFLLLVFMAAYFSSCYDNVFNEELFRTMDDPFYDVPEADSLTTEHTIYLSWKADDASDTFFLMRSFDVASPDWACVYAGNATAYTDKNLSANSKYIYRLDKTRGEKYFEGAGYCYGWSSGTRKDYCEPNDTEQTATFLEYDRICNLPCTGFVTGQKEFLDEDWFYVTIPPMRQAEIVIGQHNLEDTSAGAKTNLRIQVAGLESQSVKHLVAYPIKNASYETRDFYFKIFPERTSLSSGNSFCTVIEYTVSLNQIIKY